jgi:Tol biopolymer transport system component
MKRCPECRRDYFDETLAYCLDDGTALVDGPASGNDHTTVKFRSPESLKGGAETEADTRVYTSGDVISHENRRRKVLLAAAIVVVALLVAGFGYGLYSFLDKEKPLRSTANMQTQRLTGDGKTRGAEISPDGKLLAYIRTEGVERSIWIKQILTNSNIQIVKPGELDRFGGLVFSPDGNFLFFNAERKSEDAPSVYRVPILGGTPSKVFSNAYVVQFSPDGKQVSYGRFSFEENGTTLYIANADGSGERRLASRTGTQFFVGGGVWSPDGTMLAAMAGDDALDPEPNMSLLLIPANGGETSQLGSKMWRDLDDIAWHPSGDSLIIGASDVVINQEQLWEVSYPDGEPRRITNDLNRYASVSITADGKSLVTGEVVSRSAVWVSADLKPENARSIMPNSGDTWGIGWTPDNRIVYASDQTGDVEIWIMDADGRNAKALTSDKIYKTTPVASPDGKYIVYMSSAAGGQIVRIDRDGSNPVILSNLHGADNPDISIDSQWVIFSSWENGISKIFRVPISGGEAKSITSYRAIEPRYSHDGRWIACFIPNEKTQNWTRLAIIPAEGGEPVKVFDAPPNVNVTRGPVWTHDDQGITMVIAPGEQQNLWLQPVDGGAGRQMTNFDLPGIARREYSRDGKRIAIVRAQGTGTAVMITGFR